jgi:hypothetical protein
MAVKLISLPVFKTSTNKFNVLQQSMYIVYILGLGVRVMVFNATFNNISVISWRSVLLVEETGENQ